MDLPAVLLEVAGLLTLAVLLGLLARRVRLPLTVVLVVVGVLASSADLVPTVARLEGEVFETVVVFGFLPLLVFAAALDIDLRAFVGNLGAIVALAVVAFSLSAVLVGLALHVVLGTTLVVAFLFGVLISATDPVAVVAIFRDLGVPRRLLTMVEGESLLNDGVAIVLFAVLLEAATGGSISVAAGLVDVVAVFAGGAAVGAVLGLAGAAVLPWLEPLPAVALSLAVAYGSFVLADEVLSFSGVMATAVAGMVLSGLAPSRASAAVRVAWAQTWEALDYIANALLFLLIGLALQLDVLLHELGPVLLAVVAVLVARGLAVLPVVWLLERVARVARVGRRNEAVLVWGGLRGGVALALALALPEELEKRELLVTLTGGVVLATLLLNATTIGWLVHRLHLDEDSPVDRFLSAVARVAGMEEARKRVAELGLTDAPEAVDRLEAACQQAQEELHRMELDDVQQTRALLGRALHIERTAYQTLSDQGLLQPAVTRTLLRQVDDEVEEMAARGVDLSRRRRGHDAPLLRLSRNLLRWLPEPAGEDPVQLAYAEASARRLAARQTREALTAFEGVPGVRPEVVERVRQTFTIWENEADAQLEELDEQSGGTRRELHERQATLLAEAAAARQVGELVDGGLLPERLRRRLPGL
ncbi:hypothetical protein BH24ACT10_BH24ACT10_07200 [soil metagenome]